MPFKASHQSYVEIFFCNFYSTFARIIFSFSALPATVEENFDKSINISIFSNITIVCYCSWKLSEYRRAFLPQDKTMAYHRTLIWNAKDGIH
ncbi:hypothetical protein I7I48_02789 [Histoplasma ohiense]|nr:hypothetical protein I7I48_02789 [Histoplasma ohiense (nom. inval.)]